MYEVHEQQEDSTVKVRYIGTLEECREYLLETNSKNKDCSRIYIQYPKGCFPEVAGDKGQDNRRDSVPYQRYLLKWKEKVVEAVTTGFPPYVGKWNRYKLEELNDGRQVMELEFEEAMGYNQPDVNDGVVYSVAGKEVRKW
jgi:hypothetical protein